ncbi:ABC transporter substrate-binding protein [Thermopolyspora flexuosa]|jgi:ABC-type nitrate/sulfonate/bicarbonate transport system substrate-binding protein|uniref:Thiamine pyrimidine synthase n=1 Tax=Thermopolyspora flexuosa TaxID=103836 RepID=A0A543ISH3_9ACTN|nr:ABC transporter substrate-binding protein [Thermopolyspora flexuosa]MDI9580183.1 ABC transporter substrate-binding protein [Thermobispora sp.]TQM73513.1 NitT/TauT family transport system substrate-binding protein [Thermopolyspora flexuosa]GGM81823.1 ABC transporter substrate-binding protein [Thermopolyspora flexuosa]
MDRRKFLTGAGFLVTTLAGSQFLVACGAGGSSGTESAGSPGSAADNLRNLVYVTPFQHIIAHADVYVAQHEGYFAEEGLYITAIGGTGTASSVSQVAAGQAMFGKAASIITCPLIADQNTEIVTIGQKDQVSQYSVASAPDKPLTHPEQWQGKTIGVISKGGSTELLLDAMSVAVGLDPTKVKKVVTGADVSSLEFLTRGEVDGFITYIGSETAFRQKNIELHYLNTDQFAPMPGDSYFVTKEVAQKEKEAITGFLRACRKAWNFMADPANHDKVLEAVGKYNEIEVSDKALAKAKLEAELKVSKPANGDFLSIDLAAWEKGIDLMRKSGIIKDTSRPVSDFVTTEFLDAI